MLKERLNLDERDLKIVSWFMEDPYVSQMDIAKRLKLSQPSINIRINKLRERGVINTYTGLNFSKTNLFLVRVDFTANKGGDILREIEMCPFFVNGYVMSGKNNISIYLISDDLKKIDEIINFHIRSKGDVSDVSTNVVVSSVKDMILNLNLKCEINHEKHIKLGQCEYCCPNVEGMGKGRKKKFKK